MNRGSSHRVRSHDAVMRREVERKARRKWRAERQARRPVWFGLGTFGVVGWTVVIPSLAGALLGLWLDRRYPGERSWTLALLLAGLAVGCGAAWQWVARQDRAMREESEVGDE